MRKFAACLAAAAALATGAFAADFGPMPVDYQSAAESYISGRLTDPRAARFQFVGEPYQVVADFSGRQDVGCWAVDVRVKARLPGGRTGAYQTYTVLFVNGAAIALEDDARSLDRV